MTDGPLPLMGEILPRSLNPDSMVLQHNSLARGKYDLELEVDDIRLLNAAMAMLEKDADVLGDVTLSLGDMRRIFPSYCNNNRTSVRVSEACGRIMGLVAHVTHGVGSWDKINLVKTARYRSGNITISFHEDAKSLFLRLSGNFTSYRVQAIQNLKNTPQILLYQVARSFAHVGGWETSPKTLRQALNVKSDAYAEEHRFLNKVIKPSIEHINQDNRTDIVLSVEPVRRGRNIVSYRFRISIKEDSPLTVSDATSVEMLVAEGITNAVATRAVRQFGGTTCVGMISAARFRDSRTDQPKLESRTRYLGKLLSEGVRTGSKDPEYEKTHEGILLAFRLKIFEKLSAEAKKAHIEAFKAELPDKLKFDMERFKDPTATGQLNVAWNRYVLRFVANAEGAIVVTKVQRSTIELADKVDSFDTDETPVTKKRSE